MALKYKAYALAEAVTPPVLFRLFKGSAPYRAIRSVFNQRTIKRPHSWHKIKAGPIAGYELPFVGKDHWQRDMIEGTYDQFLFSYLSEYTLTSKTIYEVGAHIGFHALAFAKLVGSHGKVFAFEPNPHNAAYIHAITKKNSDLESRITTVEAALSSIDGTETFISSDKVDEGLSSGGFIDSANTIWEKSIYETKTGFTRSTVKTIRLDTFLTTHTPPDILKIDVEGAEGSVLEGGKEFLKTHSPLLLVEVHSTKSMFDVLSLLSELGYAWTLLKKEEDGRCFLAAEKRTI